MSDRTSRRYSTAITASAALMLLASATPNTSGQAPVTINGGVRADNQQFFDWQVVCHNDSPIVFIHFPHYHGDNFEAPPGWKQEWKNRAMLGSPDAPGWCRVTSENDAAALRKGQKAEFSMRINRAGALPRPGSVLVRFADDTEYLVEGVELPTQKPFIERNIMAFSLAAIFLVALLVHAARKKKTVPDAELTQSNEPLQADEEE